MELYTGVDGGRDLRSAEQQPRGFEQVVRLLSVKDRVIFPTAHLRSELRELKGPIELRAYDLPTAATALVGDSTRGRILVAARTASEVPSAHSA